MKKAFLFLCLAACSMGFVACSSDDDDDKKVEKVDAALDSAIVGSWAPTYIKGTYTLDGKDGEVKDSVDVNEVVAGPYVSLYAINFDKDHKAAVDFIKGTKHEADTVETKWSISKDALTFERGKNKEVFKLSADKKTLVRTLDSIPDDIKPLYEKRKLTFKSIEVTYTKVEEKKK